MFTMFSPFIPNHGLGNVESESKATHLAGAEQQERQRTRPAQLAEVGVPLISSANR